MRNYIAGCFDLGYYCGSVPLSMVALVFVTTMFNYNIHFGALYAFGQELSKPSQYGKISSYLEIQNQATSIFSGAFAALLTGIVAGQKINIVGMNLEIPFNFQKWEMHQIFLLDGITYGISIFLVSLIRYKSPVERVIDTSPIIMRIKTGIAFLKKHPAIFSFGNYSYSIFVILMVQVFMLLPLYVKHHLEQGSDVYASAEVLYSAGAMMAGLFIRKIFRNRNTVFSVVVLLVVTSLIFYMVAFTKSVGIFYIFSFIIGITNAGARVLRTTYLFSHVSNDIIGRTNSVFNVINILLRSLLLLLFSLTWFHGDSNITWAYAICGTFTLVSAYLLMRNYNKL
ncbi:MAG: MFS transporter [Bacteroidetes bacterium]|nr:MFS transporter [Bacteroidota bacterium]